MKLCTGPVSDGRITYQLIEMIHDSIMRSRSSSTRGIFFQYTSCFIAHRAEIGLVRHGWGHKVAGMRTAILFASSLIDSLASCMPAHLRVKVHIFSVRHLGKVTSPFCQRHLSLLAHKSDFFYYYNYVEMFNNITMSGSRSIFSKTFR